MTEKNQNNQPNQSFNIGGNVNGNNVNIGGSQTFHGDMTANNTSGTDLNREEALQFIRAEIAELRNEISEIKAEQPQNVEKVDEALVEVEETLDADEPCKERLQITGENLVQAAKNLAIATPHAVSIAKALLALAV